MIRKVAMTIKQLLFSFGLLFLWIPVFSQNKDFGVWYGGNISHEIFNKIELGLGVCLRTNNNSVIRIKNKDIATDKSVLPRKYHKPPNCKASNKNKNV